MAGKELSGDVREKVAAAIKKVTGCIQDAISSVIGDVGSDEREIFRAKVKAAVAEKLRELFGPDPEEPPAA